MARLVGAIEMSFTAHIKSRVYDGYMKRYTQMGLHSRDGHLIRRGSRRSVEKYYLLVGIPNSIVSRMTLADHNTV